MKKRSALVLICFILLAAFTACGEGPAETTEVKNTSVATSDENTPDIPADVTALGNIAGDFNILVSGNWTWNDFESAGEEGTVVETAIYRRNEFIKEKYGVNITNEDIVKYASALGSGDGYMKMYSEYMAGDHNYDAAMIGTYDVATLAFNGYIYDLNRLEYLNLDKSYWDQRANEDLEMNGKMFYTTGDISVADNRATYVLFFSKSMVDSYGLDNPYQLVDDNEWTLEKFAEMVKSVGEDVNQDGIHNKEDIFGLLSPTDTNLAILAAANERICQVNDDGEIELTFYNERVVNLYDKYLDLVTDHAHTYNYQFDYATGKTGLTSTNEERISMFNSEKALFYSHTMFYMDNLRDIESDFGILPYPKFDENQENYGNLVSAWHSQFVCVPANVKDTARTGIVLEELAHKGKQLLTPAYYEKTLNGQYVRDEESSAMLDIIFDNLVYDIGIYYNIGTYKDQLTPIARTEQSITTIYETYRTIAETNLTEINNFFNENAARAEEEEATPDVEPVTNATVVYIKDGGRGSGESAESPLASFTEAYTALDLSKDCTIVVCGKYTQINSFDYGMEYDGSVTITSVYNGVDYRENGAEYSFAPSRFIAYGATKFENINFNAMGTNLLIVAQFNPFTLGEGVVVSGSQVAGGSIAKAICIVGGYQNDAGLAKSDSDEDVNITVLSGSKLYILPFTRQVAGKYTGTANVHIGGEANVSVLHGSSAYPDGIEVGDVKFTITDNAKIGKFYGCTQDTTVNSYEFNWENGTIGSFDFVCPSTPGKTITVTNGSVLNASDAVKSQENFGTISANFDKVN